jgi:hypothetical protein
MDNPQAFPTHDGHPGTDPRNQILTGGMTLRDWFAGQCDVAAYDLLPVLSAFKGRDPTVGELAEFIARIRLAEADAMLAARKEGQDK